MAICQDVTVSLDQFANANIAIIEIDGGSFDMDTGIADYSINQNSFSCEDGGSALVTLTVTDFQGNFDSCVSEVTIDDPLFACCPSQRDIPYPPSDFKEYQADMLITSDGKVREGQGNTHIIFQAGQEVELKAGFEVEPGAIFEALIDPCGNN